MIPEVPCRCPRTTLRRLPDRVSRSPGVISDGETIETAITNGIDAMRGWIKVMRGEGHPIPATLKTA